MDTESMMLGGCQFLAYASIRPRDSHLVGILLYTVGKGNLVYTKAV